MGPQAVQDGEDGTSYQPTLRDMVMLSVPVRAVVSPGGSKVAISVRMTNWKENCFEYVCYVHDVTTGATHIVNRTGSVSQMEWVDDRTLALLKRELGEDDKAQVWLYEDLIGEGWAVTGHKTGVEWLKPFAGGLLFRARDPERDESKPRTDRFGAFTHFEQEESASALYYVGIDEQRRYRAQTKAVTEDEAKALVEPVVELSRLLDERLSIQEVVPSPAGDAVYLNCRRRDDLVYLRDTSTYRIDLDAGAALAGYVARQEAKREKDDTADWAEPKDATEADDAAYLGEIIRLNLPQSAFVAAVSPDGDSLLVGHRGRDPKMYTRLDLWTIDAAIARETKDAVGFLAHMRNITSSLDRQVIEWHWVESGIYVSYVDGTACRVAHLTPGGETTPLDLGDLFPQYASFHVCRDGLIGLVGASAQTHPEACLAEPSGDGSHWRVTRLTEYGRAVEDWDLGTVETIRWTSKDGTEIEGVLRKPAGFDPQGTYPLVFVVHGGPRWFSPAQLLSDEDQLYYPTAQFAHKGILVVKPNYRGSLGRGQAFAELNVNNLGVGDLWDLESAVDHLAKLGWVDPERVGCMGWSQGGYISAYAGLRSDRFAAVSVGAGIADWYTYHISNDIPDFTVDYLSGSPFRDRHLYAETAPISNLSRAKTPALIQHGTEDRRVPMSNATELYRGLKEMGVPVHLFVYPGMAHPITKPRQNHAVMHQNIAWFSHYLLGEELALE